MRFEAYIGKQVSRSIGRSAGKEVSRYPGIQDVRLLRGIYQLTTYVGLSV